MLYKIYFRSIGPSIDNTKGVLREITATTDSMHTANNNDENLRSILFRVYTYHDPRV